MKSRPNLGERLTLKVPAQEKKEVLAAFAAHKGEVTAGYLAASKKFVEGLNSITLRSTVAFGTL